MIIFSKAGIKYEEKNNYQVNRARERSSRYLL